MKFTWKSYNWHVGLRVRHRVTKHVGTLHQATAGQVYKNYWGVSFPEFASVHQCHVADLIPLVKKKRREWWINEKLLKETNGDLLCLDHTESRWLNLFELGGGKCISTTRPADTTGWIKVVEVKEK